MSEPMVTAIVPAYNYGRFIRQAVDSILAQTYEPIECIVVDNGSTDDTPEVLKGYGGKVRTIRQENLGPSVARNTGVRASEGEYIAFLDADDWWEPSKIATQMRYLDDHPDVGALGCCVRTVDAAGCPMGVTRWRSMGPDWRANLRGLALQTEWVGGSCSGVLMRRRVLDEVGLFDETMVGAEDWDMWMRVGAKHQIHNVSDLLVNIRCHNQGFTSNSRLLEARNWEVYRRAVERWPDVIDRRVRRRMRALILADAGYSYRMGGDRRTALRRFAQSLVAWPWCIGRWKATVVTAWWQVRALAPRKW